MPAEDSPDMVGRVRCAVVVVNGTVIVPRLTADTCPLVEYGTVMVIVYAVFEPELGLTVTELEVNAGTVK